MNIKDIVALLDNSQDAETIALEIVSHETLFIRLSIAYGCMKESSVWVDEDNCIAAIIRELWDIAYAHGYYEGRTESENN